MVSTVSVSPEHCITGRKISYSKKIIKKLLRNIGCAHNPKLKRNYIIF